MIRVLIVEDSRVTQVGLVAILNKYDAVSTESADTVDEARLVLADPDRRPDVVLLDLRLPGLPGEALLPDVRACPAPVPRVIVMTAESDLGRLKRIADDYAPVILIKPISLEELLKEIVGDGPPLTMVVPHG